jgi:hypothetical protein
MQKAKLRFEIKKFVVVAYQPVLVLAAALACALFSFSFLALRRCLSATSLCFWFIASPFQIVLKQIADISS